MSFAGLRGHERVLADLQGELARRPSHAYLFVGPRGVGKSLVAQGLAHSILCERCPGPAFCCTPERCPPRQGAVALGADAGRPRLSCGCCAACIQVASGAHPDFNYIGRLPGRADVLIEQVRALIAALGFKPSRGPRRVAIIDDGETLNVPAQNALLKTLEEPPGDAIIFVVAQSERALLDTVRSRLRPVRFGPLEAADIEALIAERGVPPERATAIARLARGSAARALALAEGEAAPVKELVAALARAKTIDFALAHELAQAYFSSREQAAQNFELVARLLQEVLHYKVLGKDFAAPLPEVGRSMIELAGALELEAVVGALEAALRAGVAVDALGSARLQAENWWMAVGEAARRQADDASRTL